MNKFTKTILRSCSIATLLLSPAISHAQINDDCSGAISVTESTTCTPVSGNLGSATTSSTTDDCSWENQGDLWYIFTATSSNEVSISIPTASSTDPNVYDAYITISVYSGSNCSSLTEAACGYEVVNYYDGDVYNSEPVLLSSPVPGNTYYIRVVKDEAYDASYNSYNPTDLSFDLCVKELLPPANDECSSAIAIGNAYTGSNEGASQSRLPIPCEGWTSSSAKDVWYSFTPVTSGTVEISISQDYMDIIAEVFSGTCGNLQSLACVDDDPSLSFTATANTQYYLRVYGYDAGLGSGGEQGSFDIDISGVALPLNLLSFTGETHNESNVLSWQTANEVAFSHFEIERSGDGAHYASIGSMKGNNTEAGNNYTFRDEKPLNGKNMYRLKMIDLNGKSEYSKIVALENKAADRFDINAYPNPAGGDVNIAISGRTAPNAKVIISDISGKVIISKIIHSNLAQINIASLPSGLYLLKYTDNMNTKTIKLSKK